MEKYHKIQTVYKRDPETSYKTLLLYEYAKPEFEKLCELDWEWSEKFDGTNIRVQWNAPNESTPGSLKFRGKSDNAQMPPALLDKLGAMFSEDDFYKLFPTTSMCIYGEGYGCFRENTQVFLENGEKIQIGKLVNQKINKNVLTYNAATKQIESSPILNYFKYPIEEMIQINLEKICKGGRGRYHRIICTLNHLIMTDNGYKKACDLIAGDSVMAIHRDLTFVQEQALLGTLLGDGFINGYTIGISHSIKQKKYMDLWRKILGRFHISEDNLISGYGSEMIRFYISNKELLKDISNLVLVNRKKQVNKKWLNKLTPIALAIWYMDDGSMENTHRKNQRASLATQGFSEKEIVSIIEVLHNKFGIDCTRHRCKCINADISGVSLRLTAQSSEIFFTLIAPYVIESLKYKLPEKFRDIPCCWEQFVCQQEESLALKKCLVKGTEKPSAIKRNDKYMYDIQTQNENYFISNGILVHNSKIQKGGGNYIPDGVSFIAFDVNIGRIWLERKDAKEIIQKLGIDFVPTVGYGTLQDACDYAQYGHKSTIGSGLMEGLVLRPLIELLNSRGKRIITKIKHKDFPK